MQGRREERGPQSILGLAVRPSLAVTESEPFACHVVRWTCARSTSDVILVQRVSPRRAPLQRGPAIFHLFNDNKVDLCSA